MEEIKLPRMGQSVEEAEIVEWFKQEGDAVESGDPLFSIQTDKAEVECESTASGVLRKILLEPGVEVPVLTVVALVGAADEALPDLGAYGSGGSAAQKAEAASAGPASADNGHQTPTPAPEPATVSATPSAGGAAVSPRAQRLAREHHVDATKIAGSGPDGRVVEADVTAYVKSLKEAGFTPTAQRVAGAAGLGADQVSSSGGTVAKQAVQAAIAGGTSSGPTQGRVPLSPMRKIIAERMSSSKYTAPHYYVTVEIDMSRAKKFRSGLSRYKATYNDLVLYATTKALADFPAVNARWAGDAIERVGDINLGVAVALEEGLIVPVLKQAQRLSLEALAAETKALVEKAQNNKLLPDDYQGNTFTVSNLGGFGVESFTAIINQPDSAILAVGQMKDQVVVIDGGIQVRPLMKITMSSDHRVIDGALAARFMGRLKEILEEAAF
jgi:pyruvate dehydrogenase E2 component (dihydrolipoamide acetyltransferase)